MLKIKDKINLEDLKRFGFVEHNGEYIFKNTLIVEKNRHIFVSGEFYKLGVLCDLIQEDMIERV